MCRYFIVVRVGSRPVSSLGGQSSDILIEDKNSWGDESQLGMPENDQHSHSRFFHQSRGIAIWNNSDDDFFSPPVPLTEAKDTLLILAAC